MFSVALAITGNHQQVDLSPVGPKVTKAVAVFLVCIPHLTITPKLKHAVLETTSKAQLALQLVQFLLLVHVFHLASTSCSC